MRESDIEEYLKHCVKRAGGEVRKVSWVGRRGAPDRVVFLNGCHFVELKAPGKVPKTHQYREHERMAKHGVEVTVIDTLERVRDFVHGLTLRA